MNLSPPWKMRNPTLSFSTAAAAIVAGSFIGMPFSDWVIGDFIEYVTFSELFAGIFSAIKPSSYDFFSLIIISISVFSYCISVWLLALLGATFVNVISSFLAPEREVPAPQLSKLLTYLLILSPILAMLLAIGRYGIMRLL
jgi:hypothetical protein